VYFLSSHLIPGSFAHRADAFIGKGSTTAELIERLRIGTSHKRGPKPVALRETPLWRLA